MAARIRETASRLPLLLFGDEVGLGVVVVHPGAGGMARVANAMGTPYLRIASLPAMGRMAILCAKGMGSAASIESAPAKVTVAPAGMSAKATATLSEGSMRSPFAGVMVQCFHIITESRAFRSAAQEISSKEHMFSRREFLKAAGPAAAIASRAGAANPPPIPPPGKIKSFCIDFNWHREEGPRTWFNDFASPGHWADASPEEHVLWYEALGANVIQTFAVSCNGYAWYKNGVVPPQPGLKYDFLTDVVKLGHQRGHAGDGLLLRGGEYEVRPGPSRRSATARRARCTFRSPRSISIIFRARSRRRCASRRWTGS